MHSSAPAQEAWPPHDLIKRIKSWVLKHPLSQAIQAIALGCLWGYLEWDLFYSILEGYIAYSLVTPLFVVFTLTQILLPIFISLSLYDALTTDLFPTEPRTDRQPAWYIGVHVIHSLYSTIKAGRGLVLLHTITERFHKAVGAAIFAITVFNLGIINLRLSFHRAKSSPLELDLNPIHLLHSFIRITVTTIKMYSLFCLAFGLSLSYFTNLAVLAILLAIGLLTQPIRTLKPQKAAAEPQPTHSMAYNIFTITINIMLWTTSLNYTFISTWTLLSGFFLIPFVKKSLQYLITRPNRFINIISGLLHLSIAYSFHENNHLHVEKGANIFKEHLEQSFNYLYNQFSAPTTAQTTSSSPAP